MNNVHEITSIVANNDEYQIDFGAFFNVHILFLVCPLRDDEYIRMRNGAHISALVFFFPPASSFFLVILHWRPAFFRQPAYNSTFLAIGAPASKEALKSSAWISSLSIMDSDKMALVYG